MTKYEDAEDPGFVAICGELRRWVKEMNSMNSGGERRPLPGQQLVPESKEQPGATTIYGDHNYQYSASGSANQKNVKGNYYEANGNQNFGTTPVKL